MHSTKPEHRSGLKPYLSPLNVWALSFGCAVGWGAFVMPGSTFLPIGGPLGMAVGMGIGACIMLIIGCNYHYMMNRCPDAGGTYTYAKRVFGYDHGFLSAWFLLLVYVAITWANATAIPLICRHLLGDVFQVGLHYQVAGFDVYLGEVLLALSSLWLTGFVCIRGRHLAARIQTIMALLLIGGVLACFCAVLATLGSDILFITPSFPPNTNPIAAVIGIVVLAPWAFAGFESISHGTEEFRFSPKKSLALMLAALIAGAIVYTALSLLAASALPAGYRHWPGYIQNLSNMPGLAGLPTFYATDSILGQHGLWILACSVAAAVITGLIGNTLAMSRLVYAMARDNLLPDRFLRLNDAYSPRNIFLFFLLISLPIPFFGRTAISWIVDVNTIGATIAYAYTSATAFMAARKDGNRAVQATGAIGCVISLLFFIYFMVPGIASISTMATEAYLILIVWSILGFVFFHYIFQRDTGHRFGRSTVTWIALLFMIFFTSMLWFRQTTQETTESTLGNLGSYYREKLHEHGVAFNRGEIADTKAHFQEQIELINTSMTEHNIVQMTLIIITLFIMFSIYNVMMRRGMNMERQKAEAEQSNKAKSIFFFNMSHDIRTPMNAIVGYAALMKKDESLSDSAKDYLRKIEASSDHLLALINDILEMSRIENGKMELEIGPADLVKALEDVRDLFAPQMEAKHIAYAVDTRHVADRTALCDAKRLNRVLLNLVSNAYKFTPQGGKVSVTLQQTGTADGKASYEIRVKDTGMGMTPEFAAKIFEAYTRDRTADNIQGTGLGMAITKSIIDLMNGSIEVHTAQGKGSEFIVRLDFPIAPDASAGESLPSAGVEDTAAVDFSKVKLLLVEDLEVNREIAMLILGEFGFHVETAENGKVAVEKIAASHHGEYQLILMDVQMPIMNGYDAAKAIRALPDPQLASIPIVAMTANAFAEDVENATAAGMNGHIAKPLDIAKMMETLTEVLRESGRETQT